MAAPIIQCTECHCNNAVPANPTPLTKITCHDCGCKFSLRHAHQVEHQRAAEAAKPSG